MVMEKKLLEYEKFIKSESAKSLSPAERANLQAYHREMLVNFQHERLIHLIVTLFFALFAISMVVLTGWAAEMSNFSLEMIPLYILALMLVILTFFYVKHYYFLENHIQGLYKYSALLYKK